MNMRLTKEELAALCREYGPRLHVPAGVDGAQMLWAFAGRETSFGIRCVPLHEGAYCYGGKYYSADKLLKECRKFKRPVRRAGLKYRIR